MRTSTDTDGVPEIEVQERIARAQSSTYRLKAETALTHAERDYYLALSRLYHSVAATHRRMFEAR